MVRNDYPRYAGNLDAPYANRPFYVWYTEQRLQAEPDQVCWHCRLHHGDGDGYCIGHGYCAVGNHYTRSAVYRPCKADLTDGQRKAIQHARLANRLYKAAERRLRAEYPCQIPHMCGRIGPDFDGSLFEVICNNCTVRMHESQRIVTPYQEAQYEAYNIYMDHLTEAKAREHEAAMARGDEPRLDKYERAMLAMGTSPGYSEASGVWD